MTTKSIPNALELIEGGLRNHIENTRHLRVTSVTFPAENIEQISEIHASGHIESRYVGEIAVEAEKEGLSIPMGGSFTVDTDIPANPGDEGENVTFLDVEIEGEELLLVR